MIDEEQWKEKDVIIKSLNLPYLDKPIEEILTSLEIGVVPALLHFGAT